MIIEGCEDIFTARRWLELFRTLREEESFDSMFPEVAGLRGVPQPERYHQEGDAYTHTMLAVEAVSPEADVRVFWGTLLHDIGKAATTRFQDGRIHSYGHAEAGAAMVPEVMGRIGLSNLAGDVSWLVQHHTFHFSWNIGPGFKLSGRRLRFTHHPLFPLLLDICIADAVASLGGEDKLNRILLIREQSRCAIRREDSWKR